MFCPSERLINALIISVLSGSWRLLFLSGSELNLFFLLTPSYEYKIRDKSHVSLVTGKYFLWKRIFQTRPLTYFPYRNTPKATWTVQRQAESFKRVQSRVSCPRSSTPCPPINTHSRLLTMTWSNLNVDCNSKKQNEWKQSEHRCRICSVETKNYRKIHARLHMSESHPV